MVKTRLAMRQFEEIFIGETLADFLDTLKAVHAVGRGILLIVLLAELGDVAFKDSMELVAPTGNMPFGRNRL